MPRLPWLRIQRKDLKQTWIFFHRKHTRKQACQRKSQIYSKPPLAFFPRNFFGGEGLGLLLGSNESRNTGESGLDEEMRVSIMSVDDKRKRNGKCYRQRVGESRRVKRAGHR